MHGAMAGYTGFTVGPVNGRHVYIPIATAVETQNKVNVTDRMWARLLSSTQQPDFLNYDIAIEEKKKNVVKGNGAASQKSKEENGVPVHEKTIKVKDQFKTQEVVESQQPQQKS